MIGHIINLKSWSYTTDEVQVTVSATVQWQKRIKATLFKAYKIHECSVLHRNGASPPGGVGAADACSASCVRQLSVAIRLRFERPVRLNIADHTRALVCKACECQCLAYIQNFRARHFVPKKWVLRGINRRPVRWSQGLGPTHYIRIMTSISLICLNMHLRRNVRVEMSRISRITKLRSVRRCIAMYIQPVNSFEQGWAWNVAQD